jgi:hypothetical protein
MPEDPNREHCIDEESILLDQRAKEQDELQSIDSRYHRPFCLQEEYSQKETREDPPRGYKDCEEQRAETEI